MSIKINVSLQVTGEISSSNTLIAYRWIYIEKNMLKHLKSWSWSRAPLNTSLAASTAQVFSSNLQLGLCTHHRPPDPLQKHNIGYRLVLWLNAMTFER